MFKVCFNSRTPGGVLLLYTPFSTVPEKFQFTHPGRGATFKDIEGGKLRGVSIHAPREGCDCSSLEEVRVKGLFQFTHPGRGATSKRYLYYRSASSFNSRTPGGVRRLTPDLVLDAFYRFNSRTPGGVRLNDRRIQLERDWFQFTHPGRGATASSNMARQWTSVSIHAPREGCD